MIPELKIHLSPHCREIFYEEDFEFGYLRAGHCPCYQIAELVTFYHSEQDDEDEAIDFATERINDEDI
ncbi:hypothetical protein PsorP6_009815 [Peronosclerospora sorghi]|uniref:Uncharacterized protein n=1 Tax=Peronosclerospora sorghi TaxID=230839 RepID=A0ACC0W0P4_9STRA|nr:hypothetical protein PsorP6_009815 [Peronosclerospora sorghi]